MGYSEANAKIKQLREVDSIKPYLSGGRKVYSFDLISGWTCPYANLCLSKVCDIGGKKKVVDGPNTQFRCFSASQEALLPNVYNKRLRNFVGVREVSNDPLAVADYLYNRLPEDAGVVRIHVGGDFFNRNYFMGWLWMAVRNPHCLFYAYTKSLKFWVDNKKIIPQNFVLTASRGGKLDDLINKHKLREAIVVFSEQEAENLGLEIDHDDSHAADPAKKRQSFALLLHGTQPAGSEASVALRKLNGKGSYSK